MQDLMIWFRGAGRRKSNRPFVLYLAGDYVAALVILEDSSESKDYHKCNNINRSFWFPPMLTEDLFRTLDEIFV